MIYAGERALSAVRVRRAPAYVGGLRLEAIGLTFPALPSAEEMDALLLGEISEDGEDGFIGYTNLHRVEVVMAKAIAEKAELATTQAEVRQLAERIKELEKANSELLAEKANLSGQLASIHSVISG